MSLVLVTDARDGLARILDLRTVEAAIQDKERPEIGTLVLTKDEADEPLFIREDVFWLQRALKREGVNGRVQ